MIWEIISKTLILGLITFVIEFLNYHLFKIDFITNNSQYFFYFALVLIVLNEMGKNKNDTNNTSVDNINKSVNKITQNFSLTQEQKQKILNIPNKLGFQRSYENTSFDFVNLSNKTETKKEYDEVRFLDNGCVEFYNKTGFIDINNYRDNNELIAHALKQNPKDKPLNLKIIEHSSNSVLLDIFDRFPKGINFDFSFLRKGFIFIGFDERGEALYVAIKDFGHFAMSGASGAGKTVTQRQILNSLIFNLDLKDEDGNDYIDQIILVDYKIVSYFHYQKIHHKIKFAMDNEEVEQVFEDLFKENKKRQIKIALTKKINEETGEEETIEKIESNAIFVIIDEAAEYKDSEPNSKTDKEKYDKYMKGRDNLMSLVQTGRSQNIKCFIASQTMKSDVIETRIRSNLQNRMCMKAKDEESVVAILGSREPIEKLGVNPKLFDYGRMVLTLDTKDGVIDYYLQSLYSKPSFYNEIMKYYGWKRLPIRNIHNIVNKLNDLGINIERDLDKETQQMIKDEIKFLEEYNKKNNVKDTSINLNKLSYQDLENKRNDLWKKTNTIEEEEIKKTIRSKLAKLKSTITNKSATEQEILLELNGLETFF